VTWVLAAVLVVLNALDVLLIIVLDLDNAEVSVLPIGPRILAAIFQAASARHTGTATFNLANVNPAVQFSLLVMMYISIYPIAISIRMSNSYEDRAVGIYGADDNLDEKKGSKLYFFGHLRNQLSFDLWYIFLGVFCITAAESKRIMDREDYVSLQHILRRTDMLTPCRLSLCFRCSLKSFRRMVMSAYHWDILRTRHRCVDTSLSLASW
jgi:Trk-type K+ transport system membrane component